MSTLVTTSIPNLTNGVSQQPPALRLLTACEEMINAWPGIVSGLAKRPSTRSVAKLSSALASNSIGYIIDRDPTYRYIVAITNGDLKVYSLDGVEQTVTFPDGKAYLAATSPIDTFKFATVGDTTFILNRDFVVTGTNSGEPSGDTRIDPTTRTTFYVTQAIPNSYYSIYIDNVLKASFLTNKNTSGDTVLESTSAIATALTSDLNAAGYTATRVGSTISVTGIPFSAKIVAQSGDGDNCLKFYKDEIQSFSDLPPTEVNGRVVRVKGDVRDAGDDYYVSYKDRIWTECVGYNGKAILTNSTMPHTLVRNADGTWTFSRHTWSDRIVGDANSNSMPSFVGYKLRDIFLYSNRLGLLSEENVIMSETNEYENFFRTTLTTLIDSDPPVSYTHLRAHESG
jgi:hypothetical protein